MYELTIAWRTIRREGFSPLFRKVLLYFRQIGWGIRFFPLRLPHGASPEEVIAFGFDRAPNLIGPSQLRSEIIQLAAWVHQRKPQTVVEIGTANGGTLFIWCALADPRAVIVSIDLPGGIHGGGYPRWKSLVYRRFAQPGQSLRLLRVDSHLPATRDQLKTLLPPEGIDFLFIDGDHTYAGVKRDFEMYSPLVRRGGLVAFHDICPHPPEMNCDVDKFWREIRAQYPSREFVETPNQGYYGIGVLEL
ncbi:MAG: class I SAM-dependent methyltransferase [Myxococcaceae bacterium]